MIGASLIKHGLVSIVVAWALIANVSLASEPAPLQPTEASGSETQSPPRDPTEASQAEPLEPVSDPQLTLQALQQAVPDPEAERLRLHEKLAGELGKAERRALESVLERLDGLRRPVQTTLGLDDAIRRALSHSFAIRIESYNPAVEQTRVVEAEAAFDPLFFANLTRDKVERPSGSPELTGTTSNSLSMAGGIRKLLPTGLQVTTSFSMTRSSSDSPFQVLDPVYFGQLQMELRQPLARGFGLDYNRSLIHIAKNSRTVSDLAFHVQVRDTVISIERAYWDLVRARREVVVAARLLAELEQVLNHLRARADFDVVPIQLYDTEARLERNRAAFVRSLNNVRNTEDALIALMNDPQINLADDVELLPTAVPSVHGLLVDRIGELQTALDHRPEIRQAELTVDNAKLAVGREKNEMLSRVDMVLRYSVDGLGANADQSFDQVTDHDFTEYFFGLEFELPIGNRAPRAAWFRAKLQHEQARFRLMETKEQVLLDVNVRVRELQTTYDQLSPNFKSVVAADKQVNSIVARAERKDFTQLNAELNAREGLAASRRALLDSAIDFNLAIAELERAKGTLLGYNGIVIEGSEVPADRAPERQDPRAIPD
ncbi:MAG: TolC family protein [Planctomycetes bacterium]|nr:TolC family protein [Planctomycetota bacterium]